MINRNTLLDKTWAIIDVDYWSGRSIDMTTADNIEELYSELDSRKGSIVIIRSRFAKYPYDAVTSYVNLRDNMRGALKQNQEDYPDVYDWQDEVKAR